jgi:hypothetical protein
MLRNSITTSPAALEIFISIEINRTTAGKNLCRQKGIPDLQNLEYSEPQALHFKPLEANITQGSPTQPPSTKITCPVTCPETIDEDSTAIWFAMSRGVANFFNGVLLY